MRFEWGPRKALSNLKKHGISFDEAAAVFDDIYAILLPDRAHSNIEDRFLLLGYSHSNDHLLLVCHCYRHGEVVRIIFARKAEPAERRSYWEERHHA